MPRYINEDDFCEYIRKNTTPSGAEWFISKIKDMPDADVVEVKHGKWVDADGNYVPFYEKRIPRDSCYCSVCGEWLTASDEYYTVGNFCPNCGADMRKRKKTE